jgi:hypothetical protein
MIASWEFPFLVSIWGKTLEYPNKMQSVERHAILELFPNPYFYGHEP